MQTLFQDDPKGNKEWQAVNLPHTWNKEDVMPWHARTPYRDRGIYHKELVHFKKKADQRYYLHFEGAGQETDVYINEAHAGNHKGGYTAFTIDVTPFLRGGNNSVVIQVNNRHHPDIAPLSADFTFFGGIYRDLYLITTSDVHFDLSDFGANGVYIETPNVTADAASVSIRSKLVNEGKGAKDFTLRTIISDRDSKEIARLENKERLSAGERVDMEQRSNALQGIKLWSPDDPYLYRVETSVVVDGQVVDEVSNPLGFRWFSFDPDKGFELNGKSMKLMGANRHQDYPGMGNALTDEMHEADMRLLKDMGANFVRLAHYPQDPAVLRAADRLGLLVWEEIPLVNEITIGQAHDDNAERMLREMIRQHYNHPSIILWGYMNEIYWKHRFIDSAVVDLHTEKTIALAKRLEAVTREEDKNRYTAMAMHNYPLYEESGIGDIAMVAGWNLYHGWYYDEFEDFGKFLDEQHRLHPNRVHIISEYGAGSDPRVHTAAPIRFDFSMEGQKRFLESFLKQVQDRPFIAGATVWNLIDFSSEMRVDATPRFNNKGLALADRTPKDTYYLYQAALADRPVLRIAETNYKTRKAQQEQSGGPITQVVDVYTNLPEATLFLNNASLGKRQAQDHRISWPVAFERPGEYTLKVVGGDAPDAHEDQLRISMDIVPARLDTLASVDLAVNAGAHYAFLDHASGMTWLPDQPYQKGSWGYVNPEQAPQVPKIASLEDISVTDLDPLYQSMRTGMRQYRFDVADGWYEVELLCVEPLPKMRRFADSPEPPPHPGGLRIMSVKVNGLFLLNEVDLIKDYGHNHPVREKIKVKAQDGMGICVDFTEKAIVSGIRVKAVD